MRTLCLAYLLLTACTVLAQSPAAPPQSVAATVTFEEKWPDANPQWFQLVIQQDGTAKYRSLPHQDAKSDDPAPDLFEFSFTLSPQARQFVFATASTLPRFQPTLDKIKVAFTGAKTLKYQAASATPAVLSYNYSSSPELTKLTDLMKAISRNIELSEKLKFQLRFDKLAVDSTLRGVEQIISFRGLSEPQILQPVLQRIANDPTVMNIARQRARQILESPSKQE